MSKGSAIRAGRAFVEFFIDDGKLQRGLKTTETRLRKFGTNLRNSGAQMLAGGLAGLTAVALPFKKFADFDDAIRAVGAVTQATTEDLGRLEAKAKDLGRTTSFTAIQVAGLMTELGRAGFRTDQIDAMTASVLNLARATGTDAVLAAGIMAATLRQFGMGAEHATRVANVLTVAANSTFNTVEALGESLTYAGPAAADLGMTLEDTVAILGTLGNVGVQGSNAGTAIRRLTTLAAADAAKMSKIFGVAFVDSANNARPLVDVLGDVATATKDLPTAERASKFKEAFGLLGITGASAVAKAAGSTKDLADKLRDVSTEAADAAAAMDAGAGGMLRILESAAEGLQLAIGKANEAVGVDWGKSITEAVGHATEFIEKNQHLVVTFTKIAAAVAVGGAALVTIGGSINLVAFGVGGLSTAISVATGAFVAIKAAAIATGTAMVSTVIPNIIAFTLSLTTAKVATFALRGAMAGMHLFLVYSVSKAFYSASDAVKEYNKQVELGAKLSSKMDRRTNRKQSQILSAAEEMGGEQKANFLALQLERAKKELAGAKASEKGQQKVVGNLDTVYNRTTGNKVLAAERIALEEQSDRVEGLEEFVENLETAFSEADRAAKDLEKGREAAWKKGQDAVAAGGEKVEDELDKMAERLDGLFPDDALNARLADAGMLAGMSATGGLVGAAGGFGRLSAVEAAAAGMDPAVDAETIKLVSDAGMLAGFGAFGGVSGVANAMAADDDVGQEILDIARESDEAAANAMERMSQVNSAVDVTSQTAAEEIAKALTGTGQTAEERLQEIQENALTIAKKQLEEQKKSPSIKVSQA